MYSWISNVRQEFATYLLCVAISTALSIALSIALAPAALASTTYIYTGNTFDTVAPPYQTYHRVSVTLTFPGPLASNLVGFDATPSLVSSSFSDWLQTIRNTEPGRLDRIVGPGRSAVEAVLGTQNLEIAHPIEERRESVDVDIRVGVQTVAIAIAEIVDVVVHVHQANVETRSGLSPRLQAIITAQIVPVELGDRGRGSEKRQQERGDTDREEELPGAKPLGQQSSSFVTDHSTPMVCQPAVEWGVKGESQRTHAISRLAPHTQSSDSWRIADDTNDRSDCGLHPAGFRHNSS